MSDCGLKSNPGLECRVCPQLVGSRTRVVLPMPCPPGGLLAIGEAPGADEDALGEGFVGQAGRVLNALLAAHGLERSKDYGVANIVRCRPDGNRKPSKEEINNCMLWLAAFLLRARPKVLLLVGATATETFLGPGPLYWHIERARRSAVLLAKDAHPTLRHAIRLLHGMLGGVFAFPMPHTSGMAWNRQAPNGQRWSVIGAEQVALAASRLSHREASHAA
ncbi:uracil-DNA glycosylase [Burkholderia multivorans]|uniref:uracil-DNA glycosylase n=1 Tax=Burkholderia multivorans TaxID=87883 RepID=UPI0028606DAA|nr:uracil-DNA glycosylase [Burkholderia multivorans]MDR9095488.1 Type-4 uracil-DNA glycosylase [Burkholderia multivorans]MDR9119267.1 Type-4 uracil-DNA glycosylase [Burkholderia multivorans]MDR9158932.1 Type-4 uracil-DNA glycosylase [Burkholderia multivorans]MDR9166328.1 Type-4 uracil-DNA glycosylase [Burkholderia multivorans]MDR9252952.1 Type-4 uracil-DNA glycosylase [Burkholderia multivorans]